MSQKIFQNMKNQQKKKPKETHKHNEFNIKTLQYVNSIGCEESTCMGQACHKLSKIWKSSLNRSIKIRLFRATVESVQGVSQLGTKTTVVHSRIYHSRQRYVVFCNFQTISISFFYTFIVLIRPTVHVCQAKTQLPGFFA